MDDQEKPGTGSSEGNASQQSQPIVIQTPPDRRRSWLIRFLIVGLVISVLFNLSMYSAYKEYFTTGSQPREKYESGSKVATNKIAIIRVSGTIMPPYTERILNSIEKAEKDENVKGVVLSVDSPGGLVADSHQIYHRLQQLREKKPIFVAMQRLAASGGYYVAMGAGEKGNIYAEPTTWTGSIGVIIPRFNISELADKVGVSSKPLKTGEFKDALSPFRKLSEQERILWNEILDDSFERFVNVIADNRKSLDEEAVRELATGQIYTSEQAKNNGLIDVIGFKEKAVEDLKAQLGLDSVRVVVYEHQPTFMELFTGTVRASRPEAQWRKLLEATVPKAMYYFSWDAGLAQF